MSPRIFKIKIFLIGIFWLTFGDNIPLHVTKIFKNGIGSENQWAPDTNHVCNDHDTSPTTIKSTVSTHSTATITVDEV